MNLRSALRLLLGLALGLPLLQMLLFWVARLLSAMGDAAAARIIERLMVVNGVVWLVALLAIIVLLAVRAIDDDDELEGD
ncbi:MAG TPA: hypothetical protein VF175_16930 [Lacipirellula sp.]